jgi:hypothetical protein
MCTTKKNFYGSKVGSSDVYRHNIDADKGRYYGDAVQPSWIDITLPDPSAADLLTSSISWEGKYLNTSGTPVFLKTFDRMLIYNSYQASPWTTIVTSGVGRNSRYVAGRWYFNEFRDMVTLNGNENLPILRGYDLLTFADGNPVNLNMAKLWHQRKRFIDTYAIIRLGFSNTTPADVYLYDLESTGRQAVR